MTTQFFFLFQPFAPSIPPCMDLISTHSVRSHELMQEHNWEYIVALRLCTHTRKYFSMLTKVFKGHSFDFRTKYRSCFSHKHVNKQLQLFFFFESFISADRCTASPTLTRIYSLEIRETEKEADRQTDIQRKLEEMHAIPFSWPPKARTSIVYPRWVTATIPPLFQQREKQQISTFEGKYNHPSKSTESEKLSDTIKLLLILPFFSRTQRK